MTVETRYYIGQLGMNYIEDAVLSTGARIIDVSREDNVYKVITTAFTGGLECQHVASHGRILFNQEFTGDPANDVREKIKVTFRS